MHPPNDRHPTHALAARPNAFANGALDRLSGKRADAAFLDAARADPNGQYCVLQAGSVLVNGDGAVWLGPAAASLADARMPLIFLGMTADAAPVFAISLPKRVDIAESMIAGLGDMLDMRAAATRLPPNDLSSVGAAKALFEWHDRNSFCSVCGAASQATDGGWKRKCPSCEAEHFPRLDPVAIMLPVHTDADGVERCLLGRQARFPNGMYSALAGFIEPGETIEEACARETREEVGLTVSAAAIHSSQPWPFPASLMIGLICIVLDDAVTLEDEITDVVWLTKEEARAALSGGVNTPQGKVWAPPPFAIAHQLLHAWVEG
jgi:NAD+ diphosphatase